MSITLAFDTKVNKTVSVIINNLGGRVIYKADNMTIGSSNSLVIPLRNRFSSPVVLQVKGGIFSGSTLLHNLK